MPRMFRVMTFCLIALLLSLPFTAAAQGAAAPIVLLMGGDLWTLNINTDEFIERTNWGYNQIPALSPDARSAAYGSIASLVVDVIEREGGIGGGPLPNNIWVLDIASNDAYRAAEQPPDAAFLIPNIPDNIILRSDPVWSPDGSRLAWTELLLPEMRSQLVVFEVGSRSSRVIVGALPPQGPGIPAPPVALWGRSGIVVKNYAPDPANPGGGVIEYLLYDLNGTLMGRSAAGAGFILMEALADYNGQEVVAALDSSGQWLLFEPRAGAAQPAPTPPEVYSPSAPATSLTAAPTLNPDGQSLTWQIRRADGSDLGACVSSVFVSPLTVSPSPDGSRIACQIDRIQIDVWDGQNVIQHSVPLGGEEIQALVWGAAAWRIVPG